MRKRKGVIDEKRRGEVGGLKKSETKSSEVSKLPQETSRGGFTLDEMTAWRYSLSLRKRGSE
jgi:hypothetical protein